MRRRSGERRAVLLGASLLLLAPSLWSQERSFLIPQVSYELGAPYAIEREPGVVNAGALGSDGFGTSIDHAIQFGVEASFPGALGESFGLALQAAVMQSEGWFRSDPYVAHFGSLDLNGLPVISTNSFEVRSTESQVRLGIVGLMSWKGITLAAGPWLGYRFSSNITQTEEIVDPPGAVFLDERAPQRVLAAGDPVTSYAWRFGGLFRAGVDLPLTSILSLSPFLATRFDAEALIDKGLGIRAFTIGGGLGFSIDIAPRRGEALPVAPPIIARVELYTTDPLTSRRRYDSLLIIEHHRDETRYIPVPALLPVATIAALADPTGVAGGSADASVPSAGSDITVDDLAALPLEEIVRRLPEAIGSRLRDDTALTLRLTGTFRSSLDSVRAEEQGALLLAYFRDRWGIDSARLVRSAAVRGERDGVLLASAPILFDPIISRRRIEEVDAPLLGVAKEIEGGTEGGGAWEMALRMGSESIARFRDGDTGHAEGVAFSLTTLDDQGEITATLSVPLAEREIVTHDTLPYRRRVIEDGARAEWILLPARGDSMLAATQRTMLLLLRDRMSSGMSIRIDGPDVDAAFSPRSIARLLLDESERRGVEIGELLLRGEEVEGLEGVVRVRVE